MTQDRYDALAPLRLAGYPDTSAGLIEALGDLGETRAALAHLLAEPESIAALQGARACLDRARGHRFGVEPSQDYVGAGWPDGGAP